MENQGVYVNPCNFTSSGHIVGMLDRDQRTAKILCYAKITSCHELPRDRLQCVKEFHYESISHRHHQSFPRNNVTSYISKTTKHNRIHKIVQSKLTQELLPMYVVEGGA